MSVKLRLSDLSDNAKQRITNTLTLTCGNNYVDVFDVVKEPSGRSVFLPFSFTRSFLCDGNNNNTIDHISTSSNEFTGTLRPHQQQVRDAAVKSLNETGSIVISAEPGFGKTITSIEMICSINQPTVIFIKQAMIMDQWKEAITKYAPSKKIAKITSGKPVDPGADIYLINPIILKKPIDETRFTLDDFNHIKLLVVDELHQIVTKVLLRAFFKFQPNHVIGLSATPYRPKMDPFEPVIAWFFGTNVVGSKLFRKHTVYCVKTGFTPQKIRTQPHTGKLDWSSVLTSQAEDPARNKLIVDMVMRFPERTWLVLVKRVDHAKTLQTMFKDKGIESETIVGAAREFDKSAKILIGTTPKIGVGFDHTPIDALCMAADVLEYFEQFLGRCMRRQDVEPIVVDFEDKFGPLLKHLKSRTRKYKDHGGKVIKFNTGQPDEYQPDDDEYNYKTKEQKTTIKIPTRRKT